MTGIAGTAEPFGARWSPAGDLGSPNLAETSETTGLSGSDAVDAHLITGGLPGILLRWPAGTSADDHLRDECADPASPLFMLPEQSLSAEFPNPDIARRGHRGCRWRRPGVRQDRRPRGRPRRSDQLRHFVAAVAAAHSARQVSGFDETGTGLIVVTRSGTDLPADAVQVVWNPSDIVAA